jgi:hypothetical protein
MSKVYQGQGAKTGKCNQDLTAALSLFLENL